MKTFNQFICEEKTPIPQINKDQFLEMLDKNKFDDRFLIHFTDSDKFPSKERHVYIPPEGVKDGRTISIPKQSGIFCWTLGEYKEKVKSALKYPEEHSDISSWFSRRKFLYIFSVNSSVKQFIASLYTQSDLERDLATLEQSGYSTLWSSRPDHSFQFMEFERGELFDSYSFSTEEKSPVSLLQLVQRLFEENKNEAVKTLYHSIFPKTGRVMPVGNWKNTLNSKEKLCFYVYSALVAGLIKLKDVSFLPDERVSDKLKSILETLNVEYTDKDHYKRIDVEKTLSTLYRIHKGLFKPEHIDRPQYPVSKESYIQQLKTFIEKHTNQDYSHFPAFILWSTILFLSHSDYRLFKTLFHDVLKYSVIFDDDERSLVNGFFKEPISKGYGINEWYVGLMSGEGKQQIVLDESVLKLVYRVNLHD